MTILKSLIGKTIKEIKYEDVYREKIVVLFTDGTEALLYPYIATNWKNQWPAMTATIIKETE